MTARLDVLGRTIVDPEVEADRHDDLEPTIEPPIADVAPALAPYDEPTIDPPLEDEANLSTIELGAIQEIEILGDYVLVKNLARGAMCEVWLGLQMFLGELVRPVIIKRI